MLPLATAFISAVIDALSDASREITPQAADASREITPTQAADASREITPQAADAYLEITPQAADAYLEITPTQVEDPSHVKSHGTAVSQPTAVPEWTGPREGETAPSGMLYGRVPGDRWPYGPPSTHEAVCNLFPHRGSPGGLFCDCAASAADDVEYGVSSGQGTGVGA